MSEFPTDPTRRQIRKQQEVAEVIRGMQDVFLEVSMEQVDEILEDDPSRDRLDYEDERI